MNQQSDIDPAILEAIEESLKKAGLNGSAFGRKFERRLINKLSGQFEKSDLLDLIEDLPISERGASE